ncbi:hypothetical protein QLX08_005315 [Tetragonisca angustula]|uniref:Endonuclease/exonuclease/phosphatase domain-containing protein n=1 Tax=Tetragonisca angustula TaxID=166442 RepID=A0AAW0ZYX7_9HYME
MEEKKWNKWRSRLSRGYRWEYQPGQKEKRKGRANGGILVEMRRELIKGSQEVYHVKGAIGTKITMENDKWIVWTIYNREKLAELLKQIEIIQEEERNTKMLLGGDFNARTGEKGGIYEGKDKKKSSKDKICDREGKDLLEVVENNGWHNLNGNVEGDEKGEYTFIRSTGQSVIDYTIVDTEELDKVREFIVKEGVESDHMPVYCKLEYKIPRGRRRSTNKMVGKMERRKHKEI